MAVIFFTSAIRYRLTHHWCVLAVSLLAGALTWPIDPGEIGMMVFIIIMGATLDVPEPGC